MKSKVKSKINLSHIAVSTLLLLAASGCTRAVEKNNASLTLNIPSRIYSSSGNGLSAMAVTSSDLGHLIINITGPGIPAPIFYSWESRDGGVTPPPQFVVNNIPQGESRLVQVLAIYKNTTSGSEDFYYGDQAGPIASDSVSMAIQVTPFAGITGTGQIAGRYVYAGGTTGPTGLVRQFYTPSATKPRMLVHTGEINQGWFNFFALKGATFDYELEDGTNIFGQPVGISSAFGTAPLDAVVMRVNVPDMYRSWDSNSTTRELQRGEERIFGWFGPGSTGKQVCYPTATGDLSEDAYAAATGAGKVQWTGGSGVPATNAYVLSGGTGTASLDSGAGGENLCQISGTRYVDYLSLNRHSLSHHDGSLNFRGIFREMYDSVGNYRMPLKVAHLAPNIIAEWNYLPGTTPVTSDIFVRALPSNANGDVRENYRASGKDGVDCNLLTTVQYPFLKLASHSSSTLSNNYAIPDNNSLLPAGFLAALNSGNVQVIVCPIQTLAGGLTRYSREAAIFGQHDGGSGTASQLSINTSLANPPGGSTDARYGHTSVWTGSKLLVWGGANTGIPLSESNNGLIYDPSTNVWSSMAASTLSARSHAKSVWSTYNNQMYIWGGLGSVPNSDLASYDPTGNAWTSRSSVGAPTIRKYHSMINTGTKLIVWGGFNGSASLNDGAAYTYATNSWSAISAASAPSIRHFHSAVFTGTKIIVWGGYNGTNALGDGAVYDIASNTWTTVNTTGAPSARSGHLAMWSGTEMIIWGGEGSICPSSKCVDGAKYNPNTNSWSPMTVAPASFASRRNIGDYEPRIGNKLIVVTGNYNTDIGYEKMAYYDPDSNMWSTPQSTPLSDTEENTLVNMGSSLLFWGGRNASSTSTWWGTAVITLSNNSQDLITAGRFHTCGTVGGIAKCWGQNTNFQIGDGTTTGGNRITPTSVNFVGGGNISSIGSSLAHTCAVMSGAAKCWGRNVSGELGSGTTSTGEASPVQVANLTWGVSQIDAGDYFSCAIHNGAAKCWGQNLYGQLGDGTTNTSFTPLTVPALSSGVQWISAGSSQTCVVHNGAAKCWGSNTYGQIGDGTTGGNKTAPTQVNGLTSGVQTVSAGQYFTCALVNGSAKCWGANDYGQLGIGTTTSSATPVMVSGLTSGVLNVSAGDYHACAVVSGGAKCWGQNTYGQLGDGTTINSMTPVWASGLPAGSGVTSVSAGGYHSCARLSNGTTKCWGYNSDGEIGNNSTTDSSVPLITNPY